MQDKSKGKAASIHSLPTYTMALPSLHELERLGVHDHVLRAPGSICIVPPFRERYTLAAPPQLTYRGGQLMSNVEVITTFWGDAWTQQPQSDLSQGILNFFDFILSSQLIQQLSEYSTADQTIGFGQRGVAAQVSISFGSQVSDAQLQGLLQQLLSNNPTFPQPNPNRLYFLYLPPGVDVISGNDQSCQQFCGYHSAMQGNIFYAVMPYPCQSGCTGGLALLDALTLVSSLELCESITDPIPGQGWYDDANGEIGDICAWQVNQIGSYTVQKEWSNQANSCV